MSSSRHPVALDIERQVGRGGRLLATVMGLPLVDGIFPVLVLAGALTTWTGMLEVGLLVFGGSAMVAVVLAEMDGTPRQQAKAVLLIGAVLIPVAILEAAIAPTIAGVVHLATFERFAGIVILAIAAQTASARIGELLPRPAIIIGLGLLASVDPAGAELVVEANPEMLARAAATAGIGVAFALVVALASPWLRNAVDIDRFRFGSAVALGVLALSVLGLMPTQAPVALAVLGVTALLSFDPENARERHQNYHPDAVDLTAAFSDGGASQGVAADERTDDGAKVEYDPDQERAPWL
jgi:disulfide bond formation protein DsbB